MPERVQIIVEAKDATSGVLRGILGQFGAMGGLIEELTSKNISWGSVAERATTMIIDGMKEAVQETVKYAAEVRNLSQISGTSTEETSRFIQVLDDYGLSADDATTATRALTKNGLTPTIETLAKLSDEYLNANTVQERNKIIIDNLGRSGLAWVNVLNQGSAAIKEQGAAVSESLILTQKNVQAARDYELALDSWDDAFQGLKISVGTSLLPTLTSMLTSLDDNRLAAKMARDAGVDLAHATLDQRREFMEAAKAAREHATEIKNAGEAANATAQDFSGLLSMTEQLADATEESLARVAYANLKAQLSVDGLTQSEMDMAINAAEALGIFDAKAAESARKTQELTQQFIAGQISATDYANAIKKIPATVTTTVNILSQGGTQSNLPSDVLAHIPGHASGGSFTVPSGYPNDTYLARFTSGESVSVNKNGGSSSPMVFNLTYAPAFSAASRSDVERISPAIEEIIRKSLKKYGVAS